MTASIQHDIIIIAPVLSRKWLDLEMCGRDRRHSPIAPYRVVTRMPGKEKPLIACEHTDASESETLFREWSASFRSFTVVGRVLNTGGGVLVAIARLVDRHRWSRELNGPRRETSIVK